MKKRGLKDQKAQRANLKAADNKTEFIRSLQNMQVCLFFAGLDRRICVRHSSTILAKEITISYICHVTISYICHVTTLCPLREREFVS